MAKTTAVVHALFMSILFAIAGCSSSSSQDPNAAFETIENAVSSSMDASGSLSRVSIRQQTVASDPACGEHGEPLDGSGTELTGSEPDYAAAAFYCLIRQPTDGPDTLLGALDQARWLACILSGKLTFDGEPHEETVTLDTDCMTETMLTEIGGPTTMSATITTSPIGSPAFGEASAWDYSVYLTFVEPGTDDPGSLKLLVKDSDGVVAVSTQANVSGHENDALSVYLNTGDGILRYESKHQRYEEDSLLDSSGWNRHNRVLMNGAISADGTFTSLTNLEAFAGDLYEHDAGTTDDDSGFIRTIKGNPTEGFFTYHFSFSQDASTVSDFSGAATYCSDSCTGNSGIAISDASDLDFLMIPGDPSLETTSDWFADLAPLSFTSVTTAQSQ